MYLFFDLETIPTQRQDVRDLIAADISAPGNIKLPESIAKWEKESKPAAVDKAVHDTGLSGTFGEIFCIAWAVDDGEINCASRLHATSDDEGSVIQAFFDAIGNVYARHERPVFVGHYITDFDLRFLWQRAVVTKTKAASMIPFQAKAWDQSVFDTRVQWAGKDHISQDKLCMALGIEGEQGIKGAKVWDAVKDGNYEAVTDHCKGDVRRVREIFYRMQFK